MQKLYLKNLIYFKTFDIFTQIYSKKHSIKKMEFLEKNKLYIYDGKITAYFLNFSHPEGINKALFFIRFGFTPSEWETLQKALFQHAVENSVLQKIQTPFGEKYQIIGKLRSCSEITCTKLITN
jgi:hypothetical protein